MTHAQSSFIKPPFRPRFPDLFEALVLMGLLTRGLARCPQQ